MHSLCSFGLEVWHLGYSNLICIDAKIYTIINEMEGELSADIFHTLLSLYGEREEVGEASRIVYGNRNGDGGGYDGISRESETKIAGGADSLTYCAYSVRKARAQGNRLSRYSVLHMELAG